MPRDSTFVNTGKFKILGNNTFTSFGAGAVFNNAGMVHKQLDDAPTPPATPPAHLYSPRAETPSAFLGSLSAGSRAALAIAYFQRWHVELEADINATLWFWNRTDTIAALTGRVPAGGSANHVNDLLTVAANWTSSTIATIQTHAQDPVGTVTALATTVWDSTVQTVNQSVDLLRTDPLRFLTTAGEVWLNSQVVMANTLTFGLIPGLNTSSDNIVQSHGFYRGVQIAGIIGREAALAFLTGGTGNAALLGTRGLTLAARYAGPIAGRVATRLLGSTLTSAVPDLNLQLRLDRRRRVSRVPSPGHAWTMRLAGQDCDGAHTPRGGSGFACRIAPGICLRTRICPAYDGVDSRRT